MAEHDRTEHSASAAALGYLYQVRYALLEALRRLRRETPFSVSIETLDDVVFEQCGDLPELLQTKHRLGRTADLSDASPDLWKTIRIWAEIFTSGRFPESAVRFLITTGRVTDGHAAHYLKAGPTRDVSRALERLNSTADSSTNAANSTAYLTYRSLSLEQRRLLLAAAVVVDLAPTIEEIDPQLKNELYHAAEQRFLSAFLQRLEGWWYRRSIKHLAANDGELIFSDELRSQISSLREQFKQDSLPIDDDIMTASVNASGYQDRVFVRQLRLIQVGNPRVLSAIRNYFRAFEQRSRWVREDLLLVGELDRYEDRLVEEWDLLFQQMLDELGEEATEDAKCRAAQTLYKWVETGAHPHIRSNVSEPAISRGSYHLLADLPRVGWHVHFRDRIRALLEPAEVAP